MFMDGYETKHVDCVNGQPHLEGIATGGMTGGCVMAKIEGPEAVLATCGAEMKGMKVGDKCKLYDDISYNFSADGDSYID